MDIGAIGRGLRIGISALCLGAAATVASGAAQTAGFTSAQATSGATLYAAKCSQCHAANLQGGSGPALSGSSFQTSLNASYANAGKLEDFIHKQMPNNAPGSLSPEQALAVTAYLLGRNGFRAGSTALTEANAGGVKIARAGGAPKTGDANLEIVRAAPATRRVFAALSATKNVAISDAMLSGAAADKNDWIMGGHTYANDRYSTLDQITSDNVAALAPVAIVQTGFTASFETSPIVVDGVMYATTPTVDNKMKVMALDATDGARIWETTENLGTFKICCGPVNRGAAVAYGMVYFLTLDDRLIALDARTGEQKWSTNVAAANSGYSETMTPTVVDGNVVIGSAGGEWAIRGFVASYDAQTGKQRWRWNSTDPSSFANKSWQSGGGMVWTTPAVDTQLGLVIFSTGNPNPDLAGEGRKGDNLYTDSIVALDVKTGKLKWYYQEVKHDVWDYDAVSPVVLFDVDVNGASVPAAGEAGKVGWFFIVDRATGKLIRKSDPFVLMSPNMLSTPTKAGVVMLPGANGGAEWSPSAYSPKTRNVYVMGMDQRMNFTTQPDKSATGQLRLGSAFVNVKKDALQDGRFVAIDTDTGKITWTVMTDQPLMGGVLATSTNLLFMGEGNGDFNAFDAVTGKKLWHYNLGAGVNAPPITYMVNGAQYIAVAAGGNFQMDYPLGDAIAIFKLPSGSASH
jgi:PQQ-dependent dehydrogenase (methanol/ethanol family)